MTAAATHPSPLHELRQPAVDAVVAASRVCQAVQARLVAGSTLQKGDKSPVTVADFASQAIVSHLLGQHFPEIPLVGEEDAAGLRENAEMREKVVSAVRSVLPEISAAAVLAAIDRGTHEGGARGRFWVLDPIDGTKGFLRLDQYAVALALVEDGVPVLGVLGCPNLPVQADAPEGERGCIFVGQPGQGATVQTLDEGRERPVSVQRGLPLSEARFCESVEKAHSNQSHSALVAEKLGITAEPYRIDSQCKYAAVSRGDAAVYLRLPTKPGYVEKIWDHAAGQAVAQAAGATVTDATGEPLDFSLGRRLERNKGVIVTHGPHHGEVVAAVREVLGI